MVSWLDAKDAECGGAGRATGVPLRVETCDMDGVAVRGVTAGKQADANQSLLSVPFAWTVDETTARNAYPRNAPWPVGFAAFLLRERAKGRESRWATYLDTIHPSIEDVGSVLADPKTAADALKHDFPHAATAVLELDALVRDAAAMDKTYDEDAWRWAIASVLSRTLRTKGGARLMIPAVDMLNHGGAAKNIALARERRDGEGNDVIHVVATRNIDEGEQLLFTYGDTRANDDFFLYYGFFVPGVGHDLVRLWDDVGACAAWAGLDARTAQAAAASAPGAQPEEGDAVPRVPMLPLSALQAGTPERVQAPFRLHDDVALGGRGDRVPLAEEVLARADGFVDTRAIAVLMAASGGTSTLPPEAAINAVARAIAARCEELLAACLDEREHGAGGGIAAGYRREKKAVLARLRDGMGCVR